MTVSSHKFGGRVPLFLLAATFSVISASGQASMRGTAPMAAAQEGIVNLTDSNIEYFSQGHRENVRTPDRGMLTKWTSTGGFSKSYRSSRNTGDARTLSGNSQRTLVPKAIAGEGPMQIEEECSGAVDLVTTGDGAMFKLDSNIYPIAIFVGQSFPREIE